MLHRTGRRSRSDAQLNTYVDPVSGRDPFALSSPPQDDAALELDFDASDEPSAVAYVREGEIEIGADDDAEVELNLENVTVGKQLDVRDFGAIDEHDKPKKRR